MIRRARSFRPDARPGEDIWGEASVVNGVAFRDVVAPGPDRQQTLADLRTTFEASAATLADSVAALRSIVVSREPIELLSSIVIPTAMGFRTKGESTDDAESTFTWAAKIEYLVGLTLSAEPGTGSTPTATTERVIELLGDVFDAAHAKLMLDSFDSARSGNDSLDMAVFMFRMEHLFDRMPGYAVHLERIDAEVFDRHRSYYVDTIGFNPADATRVVRRRIAANSSRTSALMRTTQDLYKRHPEAAGEALADMLESLSASRSWTAESVAADTGVSVPEVGAMLAFFSTKFGVQPEFRLPTDTNVVRHQPCVDLGGGVFFVADPWSVASAVHPRLANFTKDVTNDLGRYWSHREDGHQRLVTAAMRRVFGDDPVHEAAHYVSETDGPGEIDTLVASEWPLLIEAKARGVTDPGRRGAPKRVATVADDVLDKGLEQTRRARAYVTDEDGRRFAQQQGGELAERLPARLSGITEVVVTFERMDPLASSGPGVVQQAGRAVWVVGLADLLMVADILVDPASMHHYARTRATCAATGLAIYMESDALGGYLIDRLATQLAATAENPDTFVVVGYASSEINEYFTLRELGQKPAAPSTGVPSRVTSALATGIDAPGWALVAAAVMSTERRLWKKYRSHARKHRRDGSFLIADGVEVVTGPTRILLDSNTRSARLSVPPR